MYVNLNLFFKAESLAFFRQRFSLRRWALVVLFTGIFWLCWLIVAVGRILDHLFFPGFRRQEVREPIFIVAPPRSGTTFLQNLMCLDEERFTHVRLYQTIFPAVTYHRIFHFLAWLDGKCGGILARLVHWSEKK